MELPTVVHSASADLHFDFADKATSIFDDNFTSASCMRYCLNLPEKLEKQVKKDPVRASKLAAQDRDRGIAARVRPGMQKISRHESLQEYFEFFDKDKSGAIDFKEMTKSLPEIGMNNPNERAKVEAHFKFMDKDNSGEIHFNEFIKSTIDAGMPANLADEQYAARFDKEMFTFLGLALRADLKAEYERERKQKRDDPLSEFLQFQRLVRISQAAVMPNEMSKASKKEKKAPADWVHSEFASVFAPKLNASALMLGSPVNRDVREENRVAKAAKSKKMRKMRSAICRRAMRRAAESATSLPGTSLPAIKPGHGKSALQQKRKKMIGQIDAEMKRGGRLPMIERWPGNNSIPGGHRPGL